MTDTPAFDPRTPLFSDKNIHIISRPFTVNNE